MREAAKRQCLVSGHRLSDATSASQSDARLWLRALGVILMALMFSTCAFAESGAETYKKRCAACHGATGAGDTLLGKNLKVPPLGSSEVQNKSDDELFVIIGKGKNRMPAFDGKLSKDQIHELVKYIRSLKH
jgi:cytochrome c553